MSYPMKQKKHCLIFLFLIVDLKQHYRIFNEHSSSTEYLEEFFWLIVLLYVNKFTNTIDETAEVIVLEGESIARCLCMKS